MPSFVNNRRRYSYFPTGTQNIYNYLYALGTYVAYNAATKTTMGLANISAGAASGEVGIVTLFPPTTPFPPTTSGTSLWERYNLWYHRWTNKTDRTHYHVAGFRRLEKLMLQMCREYLIPGFLADDLISDSDLESLSIRPRTQSHHNPIPTPQTIPTIILNQSGLHTLKVVCVEAQNGGHTKYMVRPKGVRGMAVQWRLLTDTNVTDSYQDNGDSAGYQTGQGETPLGTDAVASEDIEYGRWTEFYSTRLKSFLNFNEVLAGKYVEVRAAFVNPRMQKGSYSDPVSAIIT